MTTAYLPRAVTAEDAMPALREPVAYLRSTLAFLALCMCMLLVASGCERASRSRPLTQSQDAVFNLIAKPDENHLGSTYDAPVSRWNFPLRISTFAPDRAAESKLIVSDVITPLISEIAALKLQEFHGATISETGSDANVLFVIGDDVEALLDQMPSKDDPRWQFLRRLMEESYAAFPGMTCGRALGRDGGTIGAALVYISTKASAGDPRRCAGLAFADILGLRGRADFGLSIKNSDAFDRLTPLDRDALSVLYSAGAKPNGSLRSAVASYFQE